MPGKRVLLRLDLNVPLEKSGTVNPAGVWRLQRVLPTLKYLLRQKCAVIIVAHLGRPMGKPATDLSLLPIAKYLEKSLKKKIEFWADDFRGYVHDSQSLEPGQLVMLENIRFYPGEHDGDKAFAKQLSQLADVYVDDAFGNMHRPDASMLAITYYLPSYAGLLVVDEVKNLSKATAGNKKVAAIFGGAKAHTKLQLMQKFCRFAQSVMVGGVLGNTLLKAAGHNIAKSKFDKPSLDLAKQLLKHNITMPTDVVVVKSLNSKKPKISPAWAIPKGHMILDIGPATVEAYKKLCRQADVIVWNGPLGYFENSIFKKGTLSILKSLAKSKAVTIIGGGETIALIDANGLHDKFTFLSTGGGAMLSFLQGKPMPSLNRLKLKAKSIK